MRLVVVVASLFVLACAPNPKAPVKVMALLLNNANTFGPRETELETISSIVGLKGSVVNFVGGASIVLDPTDPQQQNLGALSDDQLANALYRARGTEVHANLIDKSGVLWPADFHSWNMVTSYWNFEQAFLYFNEIYDGKPTTAIAGADVLYWGSYKNLFISDPQRQDLVDNMIYYPPVRAFLIAPFKDAQKVPVSMNTGIVGHEFAHRVFTNLAFGNQTLPAELGLQGAPTNIIRSLDEGLADYHAYGVTCSNKSGAGCNTRFLEATFDEATTDKRDFSATMDMCMTVELRNALGLPSDSFLNQGMQYRIGTLIAAALFQASEPAGKREVMQKSLINAYSDETNLNPGFRQVFQANLASSQNITLERVARVIIGHITDPELKRRTCTELVDRLNLDRSLVTECPSTAGNGTACPDLPPP